MIEQMPPELADGGYWYVVEAVPDPVEGGQTPGDIPGVGWCAWYSGGLAAVRTPEPVAGVKTAVAAIDQVFSAGKPYGRIRGK